MFWTPLQGIVVLILETWKRSLGFPQMQISNSNFKIQSSNQKVNFDFQKFNCESRKPPSALLASGPQGPHTPTGWRPSATTADLNNALVGLMLTGHAGYTSAAGFIGPNYDVGVSQLKVAHRPCVRGKDPLTLPPNTRSKERQ